MSTISATFRGKATLDTNSTVIAVYNGITNVSASINTTLLSYTVPVGKTFALVRVEVNGTNIAQYQLYTNGSIIGQKRTWFGEGLNENFELSASPNPGVILNAGDTIDVMVEHFRPDTGDFDATLIGVIVN